jgi:nitrite reductase/ring-hydroxylating ferredoxin subunit
MAAINLNRRTALTALGASAATVSLAACASEPQLAATTPPSATVETQTAEPAGSNLVIGKTSDVPVGGGTKFSVDDLTILVTQPKAGDYKAFDATCTHAGCIVNGIIDNEIACGCHGARYALDSGMVLAGPAKSALGKLTIEVVGEDLILSL